MAIIKQCLVCGESFETIDRTSNQQKYCSHVCYSKSLKVDRTKSCVYCGGKFEPKDSRVRYCSRECVQNERADKRVVKCKACGKEFKRTSLKNKYCSHECFASQNIGEENHSFKQYTMKDEKGYERLSPCHPTHPYKRVHQVIFMKSGKPFKCEECNSGGEDIHHIDGDKKNNDIYNLQCLCKSCHGKKHGIKNFMWNKGW